MRELLSATPFLLTDRNSRFLAELLPAESPAAAREVIAAQRLKYPDCSHVVHAMAIGPTAGILGCSDDGEPSGTAGRPVLEVLKGAAVTDVILTVTRWFGGTKLGTGGLVRAYGTAAKGVLESAVLRERIPMTTLRFLLPYSVLESGKRLLAESGFAIQAENYGAEGDEISGNIPTADLPPLSKAIADLTRGQIRLGE